MTKRKKSRKPPVSRPDSPPLDETTHLQNTINMAENPDFDQDVQQIQNPKSTSQHSPVQNSILIEDSESQAQNPISIEAQTPIPIPVEEEQKPQLQNHDKGGNLEDDGEKHPESVDLSLSLEEKGLDLALDSLPSAAPNVSRRCKKRKKGNRQRAALEKKLKPISVEEEEDNDDLKEIPTTDQNPRSIEEEKEELVLTDVVESQNDEKGGDLEADLTDVVESQNDEKRQVLEADLERKSDQNKEDEEKQEEQQEEEEEEKHIEQEEEPQGMNLSPTLHDHPVGEGLVQPSATTVSRKGPKRKKLTVKQREAIEKKLKLVKKSLQPIPFVPGINLDFSKHEELFRRLGLWDFVNLEFDQDIRSDLLALLIANYNSNSRCSTVNECRIKVSRADLGRALKLPVKKDKSTLLETSDFGSEELSEESKSFVCDFLSNWILLHEDMWIYPPEILKWDAHVRNGEPHKVDWAGLIWYMVEKELTQEASQIGTFYYASHIQYLMKSQYYNLFKEEPMLEVRMEEEEEDTVELKIGSSENFQGLELETQQTELCLGQDKNENEIQYRGEDVMDYQEYNQEPGGSAQWLLAGKSFMSDHCLRRCDMNEDQNLEGQHMMKEHDDDEGYDPQSKCNTLGGLGSTDLLQAMDTTNISYSPVLRHHGQSSGDYFQSGVDAHLGGLTMFANAYKRELSHDNIADHHNINGHHKRMSDTSSSEINVHMEQMFGMLNKIKAMYEEKEQACLDAGMNGNLLVELQQQNNVLVGNLQKMRYELDRKEVENYKLESELNVMKKLLEGYRKALKENRRAFTEYRQRNFQPEEPLYKDVGPGGLVLSTREIEKQRLEREESEKLQRCLAEQMIEDFQSAGWFERLEEYGNYVHDLDTKILELEGKVKLCKEMVVKHKMAET